MTCSSAIARPEVPLSGALLGDHLQGHGAVSAGGQRCASRWRRIAGCSRRWRGPATDGRTTRRAQQSGPAAWRAASGSSDRASALAKMQLRGVDHAGNAGQPEHLRLVKPAVPPRRSATRNTIPPAAQRPRSVLSWPPSHDEARFKRSGILQHTPYGHYFGAAVCAQRGRARPRSTLLAPTFVQRPKPYTAQLPQQGPLLRSR